MMEQPQGPNEEPERLSAVLRNPSADWAEIRAAMRAQGRGCTNLAVMTTLSSAGGNGSNDKKIGSKNDNATAKNEEVNERQQSDMSGGDDKLMPLGENRRASLTSEDSSKKNNQSSSSGPRRRISRQSSRRRTGMRRQGSHLQGSMRNSRRMMMMRSSMNTSMRSMRSQRSITLESLGESSGSHNNSSSDFNNSSFKDSINVMDFGISQRGMRLALALDESHRSHVSLDDSALDDLREEFDEQMGRMSRRDLLVSWRHDSRISDLDASTRSESDLDDFVDSGGFMDWPGEGGEDESGSIAIDNGEEEYDNLASLQEESLKEVQQEVEEWNIEDYEFNDDSGVERRQSRKNSMSWAVAKTIETFHSLRRSSKTGSSSSLEDLDLQKIKETLPTIMAKNKQPSSDSLQGETGKKKRTGSMSLLSMFQDNIEDEVVHSQKNADDAKAMAEKAQRRKSRGEVIWARDSCNPGSSDQYKNLYDPVPKKPQRKSWNIFEGVKKFQDSEQRRSSD